MFFCRKRYPHDFPEIVLTDEVDEPDDVKGDVFSGFELVIAFDAAKMAFLVQ